MDLKSYIESGILELYVAGLLPPEEAREVEKLALQYPEIKTELDEISKAVEGYADLKAEVPPSYIKDEIMKRAFPADVNNYSSDKENTAGSGSYMKYYLAAAMILFILSAAVNIYLLSKQTPGNNTNEITAENKRLREENLRLSDSVANYKSLAQKVQPPVTVTDTAEVNKVKDELEKVKKENVSIKQELNKLKENDLKIVMSSVTDPDAVKVIMKGTKLSPGSSASVFWNNKTGRVYVTRGTLPPAPEGKEYQLWALKDGKPIDAGMISEDRGMTLVKNISAADAFAVTLEPAGGSSSPTLDQMYVMGEIK